MSNIPSSPTYIQLEATQTAAAVSSSTSTAMGASINYALDEIPSLQTQITANLSSANGHFSAIAANTFLQIKSLINAAHTADFTLTCAAGETFHGWLSISITGGVVSVWSGAAQVFNQSSGNYYIPADAFNGNALQVFVGSGSTVTIFGVQYQTAAVST